MYLFGYLFRLVGTSDLFFLAYSQFFRKTSTSNTVSTCFYRNHSVILIKRRILINGTLIKHSKLGNCTCQDIAAYVSVRLQYLVKDLPNLPHSISSYKNHFQFNPFVRIYIRSNGNPLDTY